MTPATTDELRCALVGCVLADRSDLARLRATGPDFLGLLHRLSTGDVAGLTAGEGRPTVITSPKGRIVERLFLHHLGHAGILVIAGAGNGPRVIEHLRRFTFAEKIGLSEITDETRQLVLVGPRAADALDAAGLNRPTPYGTTAIDIAGRSAQLLGEDGLSPTGFSVVVAADDEPTVRAALTEAVRGIGGCVASRETLETVRVLCGIPALVAS